MASSTSSTSSSSSSSTSFRKGTQIQMYIVERFEKRTTGQVGKTREFLKSAVCVKDDKTKIYECFVNDVRSMEEKVVNKLLKMSDGAFFAVKNCIVDIVNVKVMVNIKSKVFASGAVFDIPEDLVREYRRPAIVPLREIRRSPTKKRVSVQGVVSQIGEVRKVGDGKRIRTLELREGDDRVDLNLWGDFSDIEVSVNQHVQASGFVVSEWNNKKRLESSLCSSVEGTEKKNTFEGEVVAVTDEELMVPYEVLMNDSGIEKEVSIVEESQVDADLTHLPCFVRVDVRHEGMSDIVVKMVEVEQKQF